MSDLKPVTRDDTEHGVEYVRLADVIAEREADRAALAEWSERACSLQHELNVALRERDQARFDLASSIKATQAHGETIAADRAAMREAHQALDLMQMLFREDLKTVDPSKVEGVDAAIFLLKERIE